MNPRFLRSIRHLVQWTLMSALLVPVFVQAQTQNAVSPSQSTIVLNNSDIPADGTSEATVTVYAYDSSNFPLSGQYVYLTTTPTSVIVSAPQSTDAVGRATFTVKSGQAGTVTVRAVAGGVTLNQLKTIIFYSVPTVSASQSTLTATPASLVANGSNYVNVQAVVKDVYGNALGGKNIIFTHQINGQSNSTQGVTDGYGRATITIQPLVTGTAIFTATVDGVTLNQVSVQYLSGNDSTVSASQSLMSLSSSSISQGSWLTLTVYARNASGQPVNNKLVQIFSNASYIIDPAFAYTNQSGYATFSVKVSSVGTFSFSAKIDGVLLYQQPTLYVSANPSNGSCSYAVSSLFKLPDDNNPATQLDTTVYYYGNDCKRHVFPNDRTFLSWFDNFNSVNVWSPSIVANIPLGKNVTYRPGSKMIKFPSINKVYMISKGGVLRWVTSESLAQSYFGSQWSKKIEDVHEGFYNDYIFGADIWNVWDYNVGNEYSSASLSF